MGGSSPVRPGARDRPAGKTLAERHHGSALAAAGVLEAERGFRKLVGYRALPTLVASLRARDA